MSLGRMSKMSIKIKITLWFTFVMLCIVVVSFGVLLFVSDAAIERNYKRQLQEIVEQNIEEIEYDDDDEVLELDEDFVSYKQGIFVFIYDATGQMLFGQSHGIDVTGIPLQNGSVYEALIDTETYFIYDVLVYVEDYGELWMRGITEKDGSNQVSTINTVVQMAFIGFPVLVILAAGAGYVLTKHSFKPIEQIIASVEKINEGKDLSKRIDLGNGKDEVYRLAQSFDNMFERLEAAFEAEKKFTSDASHELRTPTTVILSQCEYILEGDKKAEEYREAIEVIERQGYKMSKLISQLLSFTRLEQGIEGINKEYIHLSELVTSICEEQAYLKIKEITIQYQVESGIYVYADETLISRVLINLISNAYKYGKEKGHIIVTLKDKKDGIYLVVQDDGIGIKEEDLDKIWRRFYRVDKSRNSTEHYSMGLGLAMVQQIANLHGAEVKVQSQFGQGSKFIFILKNNG